MPDEVVSLSAVERQLKAYVTALWRIAPPIRTQPPGAADQPRRSNFDGGILRLPQEYRGFLGETGERLFRAAAAHMAAHLHFGGPRFPVGSLKQVQIALVSLIEDARVENLAIGVYPGLRRLWLPFHAAATPGVGTAPALMARLARALIDPGYEDDGPWVEKGREMFFEARDHWHDPSVSRRIGDLLGNDLGQMRVQFNAKTYVVEPVYRDDNHGLWDYGDTAQSTVSDEIPESVKLDRTEEDEGRSDLETPPEQGDDQPAGIAPATMAEQIGVPVARYPEWDYSIGLERPEWTTIVDYQPAAGSAQSVERGLERHTDLVRRIDRLLRAVKVSRPVRLRRRLDGDQLDLDAAIEAAIDQRIGITPDPHVYRRLSRQFRDLSVLLLLDTSQSSMDATPLGGTVLDLEREAAALLAHAMGGVGDSFAMHAFCSDTRADVHYYRLKDYDEAYGTAVRQRLAGMQGQLSTRMGAALRHATQFLSARRSYRRLLLVISDGEPSDVDAADRRYLVEDARRAVQAAAFKGIDVFCVGLNPASEPALFHIFGRRNVLQIDRIAQLPDKLPMLYFRLTA